MISGALRSTRPSRGGGPRRSEDKRLKHIHLDRPGDLSAVSHSEVFEGWSVSPDRSDHISITINRRPIKAHEITRLDVESKCPGLNAKGFMFFFEPDPDQA